MRLKYYELVENLDPHMCYFRYADGGLCRESFYELDVVYFGFIRFNMSLQNRKQELVNVIQEQRILENKFRDTLYNFVVAAATWDSRVILHGFQSMHQRRTYLKFDKLQDLQSIYPEYFI